MPEVGDVLGLVALGVLVLWWFRSGLGRPPVRWTRSWFRLLWHYVTNRNRPN